MRIAILCEKPSQARDWSRALGLGGSMQGRVGPDEVGILPAHGYVYSNTAADSQGRQAPDLMVPPADRGRYASWSMDALPWDMSRMRFDIRPNRYRSSKGVKDETEWCERDQAQLAGYDELVLAGDSDPVAQGDTGFHIEAQRVLAAGLQKGRKVSVAEFANQSPQVMRRSFERREPVPDPAADPRYTGREMESRIDWATLQFSRIARVVSGAKATPRQGRLKSPITLMVGDQLARVAAYRRTPGYTSRYRDEAGVVYKRDKEPVEPSKGRVPGGLAASAVAVDGRRRATVAPPQLPDLATLAARLAPAGIHPEEVTRTYQRMYEAGLVTYPRTDDRKLVGEEQYRDLLGIADRVAACIGVDPVLLTHRSIRRTHLTAKGAHGPNRPGPSVPASLQEVEASYGRTGVAIYDTLARAALALLAEDEVHTHVAGHVADHPEYKGSVNIPVSPGWRALYRDDVGDGVNDEGKDGPEPKGMGSKAEPFIATVYPPRPSRPTVKWLVGRLARHTVGTGATRTSVIGEMSSGAGALLTERKGVLGLTDLGRTSYALLPGTRIGDVATTERTYAIMADVMAGKAGYEAIDEVADWVAHDKETMAANASKAGMKASAAPGAGASGRMQLGGAWMDAAFQGHAFTEREKAELAAGRSVSFDVASHLHGGTRRVTGRLKMVRRKSGERAMFVAEGSPLYGRSPDWTPGRG